MGKKLKDKKADSTVMDVKDRAMEIALMLAQSKEPTPLKKKEKKVVDKPQKKRKINNTDALDSDQKKKRKRKIIKPEKIVLPKIEYQFNDSIDVIGGDARNDFNRRDAGHEKSVWCLRSGYFLFPKVCGFYVNPKCKTKLKCENFDYGWETKAKYRLSTREKDSKEDEKTKKYTTDVMGDDVESEI